MGWICYLGLLSIWPRLCPNEIHRGFIIMDKTDLKILAVFIMVVLDAVATVWLMTLGWEEANPALAWVAENWSISGMAITKILWTLVLMAFALQWQEFRKYVNYLIVGYVVLYTGGWWFQFAWEAIRWTL